MNRSISLNTAIAIVIANMVGTGVFTSLGYQTVDIKSIFVLLLLWFVGGVIALCGALNYGELAAMFPRSGGEYNYLSEIYSPVLGFLSGWISITVGFAVPIAAAAIALGRYASSVLPVINGTLLAVIVVLLLTLIHAWDVKLGSEFQKYATSIKLILIIVFIISGFFVSEPQDISLMPVKGDAGLIFGSAFFISLAYVSFAYSGWNASAYLANEIDEPRKNVPRSLFIGTFLIIAVYVLINFIFLYTVPVAELATRQAADFSKPLEVGYVSAHKIFGTIGGKIMGGMIALLLVSTISAMIFAGPRVTQVMGEDIAILGKLAYRNKRGVPVYAVLLQSTVAIVLIITSSFDQIIMYIAFSLNIAAFVTVLGVIVMRIKDPERERSYKAWGYPVTTLVFLIPTLWTGVVIYQKYPESAWWSLVTILVGLLLYYIDKFFIKKKPVSG